MITPYRHLLPFRASSSANRRLSIEQTRYIRLSYRFIIKKLAYCISLSSSLLMRIIAVLFSAKWQGFQLTMCRFKYYAIETRTNIRIRIRRRVIRVEVGETVIRTVIRITAQEPTVPLDNLFTLAKIQYFQRTPKKSDEPLFKIHPTTTSPAQSYPSRKLIYLLQLVKNEKYLG